MDSASTKSSKKSLPETSSAAVAISIQKFVDFELAEAVRLKVKETETEARKEKVDLKESLKTRIALHKEHGNSAEVKRLEMELIKLLEEEYNSACKQLYTPSIISTPTNLPLQQLSTFTIVPTPAFSSSGLLTNPLSALTVQSSARTTTTKSRALKNKKKSTKKQRTVTVRTLRTGKRRGGVTLSSRLSHYWNIKNMVRIFTE